MLLLLLLANPTADAYAAELARLIEATLPAPYDVGHAAPAPVTLRVLLDAGGRVTEVALRESSGSTSFDAVAIQRAEKSGPLPLPPEQALRARVLKDGVLLKLTERPLKPSPTGIPMPRPLAGDPKEEK